MVAVLPPEGKGEWMLIIFVPQGFRKKKIIGFKALCFESGHFFIIIVYQRELSKVRE